MVDRLVLFLSFDFSCFILRFMVILAGPISIRHTVMAGRVINHRSGIRCAVADCDASPLTLRLRYCARHSSLGTNVSIPTSNATKTSNKRTATTTIATSVSATSTTNETIPSDFDPLSDDRFGIDDIVTPAGTLRVLVRKKAYTSTRPKSEQTATNTIAQRIWGAANQLISYIQSSSIAPSFTNRTIVEVGAGTGIVGLATCLIAVNATVILTDIDPISLALLRANIHLNQPLFSMLSIDTLLCVLQYHDGLSVVTE
jgi:phosphosulfolactate phosphohydrolase-like enzyme